MKFVLFIYVAKFSFIYFTHPPPPPHLCQAAVMLLLMWCVCNIAALFCFLNDMNMDYFLCTPPHIGLAPFSPGRGKHCM